MVVETVLSELTLGYLQKSAGEQDSVTSVSAAASQDGYEYTGLGGESVLTERKWGFEWRHIDAAGLDQPARCFVHKATTVINGNLEFSKKSDDYPGIPIQIKALADTSQAVGQKFCRFERVTAEKTS